MGVANKVPGVSGGLVAFVLGFYEKFIHSLQKLNIEGLKLIKQGKFKLFFKHINGQFLGLLLCGMILSYFSVSKILDYFINHYEIVPLASRISYATGRHYSCVENPPCLASS